MNSAFAILCQHCGYSVHPTPEQIAKLAGKHVKCPKCHEPILVPMPESVEAAAEQDGDLSPSNKQVEPLASGFAPPPLVAPPSIPAQNQGVGAFPFADPPNADPALSGRSRNAMSFNQGIAIIVLLGITLLFMLIAWAMLTQTRKWEYKIENVEDLSFESEMNQMGRQGWELVFARRALDHSTANYEMIFKRPVDLYGKK